MTVADRRRADGMWVWLSPGLFAVCALATAWGCKKEPPSPVSEEPASVAMPAAAGAPVRAAAAKFDEEPFALSIVPKGEYAAGKPGEVEVHLHAKAGFKCNDKYPYKFKTQESPDITYVAPVIKDDALRHEGKQAAVMTVGFTPKTAGRKTIAGQFSFSVCTEEQCLVERRDLALPIDVK